ncbi:hypothetical protein KUTeg_004087 [Tegillarca granosa]|uniref:Reverse transcriptase domain-containing protein n=1 Tax=Tegillarca granosa TaxID=220873 RepID=A0ABQ9FNX9_TEGGR|nr:hypothetical protein KUTeg_004087 [Tegillarca granosa]
MLGRLDECQLPKVIMPLTIEPSKPRLCYYARFLNLLIKDTLKNVHRLIGKDDKKVCCDEKSGCDQVRLTSNSRTYFGIQFGGWIFSYTTLSFGWKASPYIYQSIGMQVTSYLRKQKFFTVQYIDDKIAITSKGFKNQGDHQSYVLDDNSMVYVLVEILTRLGYTLPVNKCQLTPSSRVKYLGFDRFSKTSLFIARR